MKWGNRQAREEAKWEQEEEDRGELEETLGQSYEGNIGKKKLQNLQDKAEKKKQREVEQQEREEFKKKREAFDVKVRLKRENMLLKLHQLHIGGQGAVKTVETYQTNSFQVSTQV